ncbi:MAG: nucleotidyltransferase domain-containing protein [Candidatus Beckwithbacteria bacterium]|nr:nucleotidyltransferase domain-containing protein [Patescibacteria group bacterium]
MAQVKIKPEIRKIVLNYKKALELAGLKQSQVILFGSYAKGTDKPFSDIDICVVSSQFGQDEMGESVKLKTISVPVDIRIEPHPYSVKDFKVEEDPFAYEINKTGVVI